MSFLNKTRFKVREMSEVRKAEAKKTLDKLQEIEEENKKVFNGVYLIHNIEHDRKYIGSSKDINRRFRTHKRELSVGSHNNRFMQKDYDEVGPNMFKYIILERDIPEDLLTAYEKYWMYKHDSIVKYKGYNNMHPPCIHKNFKEVFKTKEKEESDSNAS